ncbi:carboxy terminal-processing peptidase [Winogradskyella psychrotolerans]|uniref:carboxy terminal-processing peptidase n=1 Tax=Winogradskyella psychrotolerans TaxID=1344585 RepID=UPI001C078085|nr:carboxy terminal-processing peptidase [Winogradskyella psychrotolerans]MBU2927632.1 carboxy terminal-processing peptidase [Winogradskyella psychrotolerans]
MKGKYKFLLLALLIAFASCSFTTKKFEDPDKDKLLIQLITYLLDQGHFEPKDINDDFSAHVFDDYLNNVDQFKRFFYESDIKEFEAYKSQIDDQIKAYDVSFFNLTHQRLLQRIAEAKVIYTDILEKPFDFTEEEDYVADYENLTYVTNKREMKERWRQQLKFFAITNYDDIITDQDSATDKTAEKKSMKEIEIEARLATKESIDVLYDYIEDRTRNDWFAVYINAIVEGFDPHTFYFAPEDKERFDRDISGKFEGIGARLQKKVDGIMVDEVISGGPAWRANELEVGDQILKVKQEDEKDAINVVGMRLADAIKYIKGPKGTVVTLTLKKVDGTIQDISITRDVVELEETYAKTSIVEKEGKTFGIINLPKFYISFEDYNERNAASDIKREILRLKEEGVEGLVMDLRNNGGGSLQTVVDIAGLFIEDGPVVQVKTTGEAKEVLADKDKSIVWDGPLVILVNELSASASEILAAAMQDYKRGIIIGSKQTYGKGTVQTVMDLNRMVKNNTKGDMGALKFTTQKFYRINGGSTQLEGVKSDVVVPDRYSYIDIGEKNLENPLAWDKIDAADYEVWGNYFDYDTTISKSKARMANNEQLKLIEANAQWVKTIRDRESYPLNYDSYKKEMQVNEEEAKRFAKLSEYQTDLTFTSLPYELKLMDQDSVLMDKRNRWHEALAKDVYVEEAINVLHDLKMTYAIKNKVAESVKN